MRPIKIANKSEMTFILVLAQMNIKDSYSNLYPPLFVSKTNIHTFYAKYKNDT